MEIEQAKNKNSSMEIEQSNKSYSTSSRKRFLVFGVVGKGKSTLLNHLADGYDSGRFPAGSGFDSCTLGVKSYVGKIFGTDTEVELYDIPGLMGADVCLETWKNILDAGFKGRFSGVLWVVSAKDRPGVLEVILRQGMEYILQNFTEENVVLAITHCDLWKPDARNSEVTTIDSRKLGEQWIDALNKNLKVKVKLAHVLTFGMKETPYYKPNYGQEFAELTKRFTKTELGIQEKIDYQAFGKKILSSVDPKLEAAMSEMLQQQMDGIRKELAELKAQGKDNELLKAILKANQDQTAALIAALNKPPQQIVVERGRGCVVF